MVVHEAQAITRPSVRLTFLCSDMSISNIKCVLTKIGSDRDSIEIVIIIPVVRFHVE